MSNDTNKTILAQMLIKFRKAHKLTQEQVANILKIKRSTYAYYERNVIPSPEILSKLAFIFNITVHELMYGKPDPNNARLVNTLGSTDPDIEEIHAYAALNKQERSFISNYRLLPENLKDKVYKELVEMVDKFLEG